MRANGDEHLRAHQRHVPNSPALPRVRGRESGVRVSPRPNDNTYEYITIRTNTRDAGGVRCCGFLAVHAKVGIGGHENSMVSEKQSAHIAAGERKPMCAQTHIPSLVPGTFFFAFYQTGGTLYPRVLSKDTCTSCARLSTTCTNSESFTATSNPRTF